MNFEYPLQWLKGQPRTNNPERARFGKHSPSKAGDYLIGELGRLGAKNCLISSNLQQRMRGDGFYAKQNLEDAGVVIYFNLKGKSKAMACDKWDKVEHNLWALYLSVQAIRGLERWGGSGLLDGLFTGFTALPSPDNIDLDIVPHFFEDCTNIYDVKNRYKRLVKDLHPDTGSNNIEDWNELQRQYKEEISRWSKEK